MATTPEKLSSGVQQLIDRLRNDGVAAGEEEAQRIVEQARKQAARIVADAKKEADEYHAAARADIQRESEAAKAAVQMAVRDTVLAMREDLTARFRTQVQRLVTAELRDKEFLRRMILAIAGRNIPESSEAYVMELQLASQLLEDAADDAGVELQRKLDESVVGISAEMLREGIELKPAGDDKPGIRARLVGKDVEIDLTDEAISEAMMRFLLPRFRYIVQGIQESA